ncbi:pentapeptide repeat-containing protein [Nocardioides albidus]|uniref:Pentapeptide repeat-containing protein n=1 Tax=Nocardioides albidus TaxID=1517589 RepID=A0A5C4WPI3_9ACTN|nr:pentapeptide repeat-containing protein [Nocardioides albidus]TNM50198.1 pentapeptide repeat-containing protein [Nocardioides albidus]
MNLRLADAQNQPFASEEACTSYAAQGGVVQPYKAVVDSDGDTVSDADELAIGQRADVYNGVDCRTATPRIAAGADLSGCVLRSAVLPTFFLWGTDFENADLTDADLMGAQLDQSNLSGANLSGADLSFAYVNNANLAGADLTGAHLAHAQLASYLVGADFTSTDRSDVLWITPFGSATCPDGTEAFLNEGGTCEGHLFDIP